MAKKVLLSPALTTSAGEHGQQSAVAMTEGRGIGLADLDQRPQLTGFEVPPAVRGGARNGLQINGSLVVLGRN